MNIWIIHHYANSPDAPGDARHFSHARELMNHGHRVCIVACSFLHQTHKHMPRSDVAAWTVTVHNGVPFVWIRCRPYRGESWMRIANMFEFAFRCMLLKWSAGFGAPDVVMGSSPHPFAALAAERLAARFRVPFVLEIRDPWPYVLTQVGGHSRFHPFVLLVDGTMRYLYRRAARIVMFSRHSAPLLTRLGADPRKIVWIPHGVDLTMTPVPRPAPEDGVFTVMYVGSHNQWNSLDAILDAAKLIAAQKRNDIQFVLIGGGSSKPGLMKRVEQEAITNVSFQNPMPKSVMHYVLHNADAFILNNRIDQLSRHWMSFNKLYEYLAAGRPVIFASYTENNPVQESGAGITVHAGDAEAMAGATVTLADMVHRDREQFGAAGRRLIETQYNIAFLARKFEAILMEIVSGGRGVESLQEAARSASA